MVSSEKLKKTVAELLDVSVQEISPDFSLNIPRFNSSGGRMILPAAIKSRLGIKIQPSVFSTYHDLENHVFGKPKICENEELPPKSKIQEFSGPTKPSSLSCGIDIEAINTFPECNDFWSHDFYATHFAPDEIAYCAGTNSPRMHFAGRWCAKEALKKCGTTFLSLPLSKIQVIKLEDGNVSLQYFFRDRWQDLPTASLSISHTEDMAIAMVVLNPTLPSLLSTQAPPPRPKGFLRAFWDNLMHSSVRKTSDETV